MRDRRRGDEFGGTEGQKNALFELVDCDDDNGKKWTSENQRSTCDQEAGYMKSKIQGFENFNRHLDAPKIGVQGKPAVHKTFPAKVDTAVRRSNEA